MICVNCFHKDTDVKNSRAHKKTAHVWRRRYCAHCLQSFTTDERPRLEVLLTVSQKGTVSPFNRGILVTSIADAFRHDTKKGRRIAWDLSDTVVDQLLRGESLEIDTAIIRTLCHRVIYRYDRAAGTQYAIAHQLPF